MFEYRIPIPKVTPFLKESTKNKVKMISLANLESEAGELLGDVMAGWVVVSAAPLGALHASLLHGGALHTEVAVSFFKR